MGIGFFPQMLRGEGCGGFGVVLEVVADVLSMCYSVVGWRLALVFLDCGSRHFIPLQAHFQTS